VLTVLLALYRMSARPSGCPRLAEEKGRLCGSITQVLSKREKDDAAPPKAGSAVEVAYSAETWRVACSVLSNIVYADPSTITALGTAGFYALLTPALNRHGHHAPTVLAIMSLLRNVSSMEPSPVALRTECSKALGTRLFELMFTHIFNGAILEQILPTLANLVIDGDQIGAVVRKWADNAPLVYTALIFRLHWHNPAVMDHACVFVDNLSTASPDTIRTAETLGMNESLIDFAVKKRMCASDSLAMLAAKHFLGSKFPSM